MNDVAGDPGSSPRQPFTSEAQRQSPVYKETFGRESLVEVVPITGMTTGRPLNGGGERPRAVFEVRAEWWGPTPAEFEAARERESRRIAEHYIPDQELAIRTAQIAADRLANGNRDLNLRDCEREAKGE